MFKNREVASEGRFRERKGIDIRLTKINLLPNPLFLKIFYLFQFSKR